MVIIGFFSEGVGSLRSVKGWVVKITGYGVSFLFLCVSFSLLVE